MIISYKSKRDFLSAEWKGGKDSFPQAGPTLKNSFKSCAGTEPIIEYAVGETFPLLKF